jgi:hypothetical protein
LEVAIVPTSGDERVNELLTLLANGQYDEAERLLAGVPPLSGDDGRIVQRARDLLGLTYLVIDVNQVSHVNPFSFTGERVCDRHKLRGPNVPGTRRSVVKDLGWLREQIRVAADTARPCAWDRYWTLGHGFGQEYGQRLKQAGTPFDAVEFLRHLLLHNTTANVISDYTRQRVGVAAPDGYRFYVSPSIGSVTEVDTNTAEPALFTMLSSEERLARSGYAYYKYRFAG